ncbi:MAG: hypothetical protein RLZ12_497 [Bacillota bacterium]
MGLIYSKLEQAMLLASAPKLMLHVPKLKPFGKKNLVFMLKNFPVIYLKPEYSLRGKGVVRIDREKNCYRVRSDELEADFQVSRRDLWIELLPLLCQRAYVIQQGIAGYGRHGRVVDFRFLVARRKEKWQVVSMLGAAASCPKITTNHKVHTKVGPLVNFLRQSSGDRELILKFSRHLQELASAAAEVITQKQPGWSEFVVDLALDTGQKAWILEVNIAPRYGMFLYGNKQKPLFEEL